MVIFHSYVSLPEGNVLIRGMSFEVHFLLCETVLHLFGLQLAPFTGQVGLIK